MNYRIQSIVSSVIQFSIFPFVSTSYFPTMKSSFQPAQITYGAPSTTPSDNPTFLPSGYPLIDTIVISIKDPTDYISYQLNIIPTIALSRYYSMLSTVQLNLAPSHITSSLTIFEPSRIPISPP